MTELQKTMIVSVIVTYCYHHITITIFHYYHIYDKDVFCYTCEELLLIVFVLIFNRFISAFNLILLSN